MTGVADVVVEPDPGGGLVVTWAFDGPPVAVDVAIGTSPLATDHEHHLTVDAGTFELRLPPPPDARRRFVSVSPAGGGGAVVAGDRRPVLAGITNLRDLGGYRVAGGGRTAWGKVFRSDALHKLTEDGLATFEGLGIRCVFDLRNEGERGEFPNAMPSTHLSIVGRPPDALPSTPSGPMDERWGESMLRDMYVGTLTHSAAAFGQLLGALTEPDGLPAAFHCHGGKDRTGVVAALLLTALGVDREDVLDDYELTRRYRRIEHQQDSLQGMLANGMAPEAAAGVLGTPRWAMAAALDALEQDFGGAEAYLTGPAGMPAEALRRLRDLLTDR